MKTALKRISLLFCVPLLMFAIIGPIILQISGTEPMMSAKAEIISDEEDFTFTLVTNEAGESSYKIALRPAMRPYAEDVVIPETYKGLPVTEIATGGFMSCVNLRRVFLSENVETIGNNAFINCTNLQYVGLPNVETIGANAFAMCTSLKRLYIPATVQSVGANILRNNQNAVYIQNSEEEVSQLWDSTWDSYYTGETYYGSKIGDTIEYIEILDETQTKVVGYEIDSEQTVQASEEDLVIYNTYRPNEESEYLPVLNIRSNAFSFSSLNSLTFRDRHADDPTAPENTTPINLRSQVFSMSLIGEINFEVDITLNHPKGLISEGTEDGEPPIEGDDSGNSVGVFADSLMTSITLPDDLNVIPANTFLNCSYLSNIKIYGKVYTGENVLPAVSYIGDSAFSSCSGLSNIVIPETVEEMGESVFYDWGNTKEQQEIRLNIYEDEIPDGWSENWLGGYYGNPSGIGEKLTITYRSEIAVVIYLDDGTDNSISVLVRPDRDMPAVEVSGREGYTFKGIYSGRNRTGIQYYTDEAESVRQWSEEDTPVLYVAWEPCKYVVTLNNVIYETKIEVSYECSMPNMNIPYRSGYTFGGYYITETNGTKTYYYDAQGNSLKTWDRAEGATLDSEWTPIEYTITYEVDLKGLSNPNQTTYTVEEEVTFALLYKDGYTFQWNIDSIPTGSTGDVTVVGEWTLLHYSITYKGLPEGTVHSNPSTYTVEEAITFGPAMHVAFTIAWEQTGIAKGTTGDITVYADATEKPLNQCYNNGVYEIWTFNQMVQLHDQPNGGNGRTYRLMDDISCLTTSNYNWVPIPEFKGILDGNGYHLTGFSLDESSRGNIGLVGINYGTIKNLTIGTRYTISKDFSTVNVGSFAGINKGTITNCETTPVFNRYYYTCYAAGDSYAGCFVGINEGTISNCSGGDSMIGSCNMGIIAGKNSGTISNCQAGNGVAQIMYGYRNYNASVGGIVGIQTAGKVENCSFEGRIIWGSEYYSENYDSPKEDREMQPCIGIMIGYKQGGSISGSSWKTGPGQLSDIVSAVIEPVVVKWTTGALFWEEDHEHDQGLYFKVAECGRID